MPRPTDPPPDYPRSRRNPRHRERALPLPRRIDRPPRADRRVGDTGRIENPE